jgi:hypothetical protein
MQAEYSSGGVGYENWMEMGKQTLEVVMKPFELPLATPPAGFTWPCEIQHQEMLPSLGNPAAMSCFSRI